MKKFLGLIWAALVVAALPVSCSREDEPFDSHTAITAKKSLVSATKGSVFVSVTCTGDWGVTLSYSGSATGWASLSLEEGSGSRGDLLLRYEANEADEAREVTLTLVPKSGLTVSTTVTQAGKNGSTVTPGGGGEGPQSGYGYDTAPMDWLELPATRSGDGRELFVHSMDGGKYRSEKNDGTRNWSCYYDYNGYTAVWVAYPHNNSLKGSGSRSDAWGVTDPWIPAESQQWCSYRVSGGRYYSDYQYDRGHQIPSADRLGSTQANISTFYPTNMTPQTAQFNQNIWGTLENNVRSCMMVADTLYVVTGCLIDNSTVYVSDRDGDLAHQIPVPTAYFKALLYFGPSSYAVADKYMAAGFFLPHDASIGGKSYWNYRKSIDELEELTGFDFFPNLIAKIGKEKADKIESTAPSEFWHKIN